MRETREAGGATARGTGKGGKGMNVALCTFFGAQRHVHAYAVRRPWDMRGLCELRCLRDFDRVAGWLELGEDGVGVAAEVGELVG